MAASKPNLSWSNIGGLGSDLDKKIRAAAGLFLLSYSYSYSYSYSLSLFTFSSGWRTSMGWCWSSAWIADLAHREVPGGAMAPASVRPVPHRRLVHRAAHVSPPSSHHRAGVGHLLLAGQ